MIGEARRHLEAAVAIVAIDSNGAYHLLYDAARKALWAHMLANGLRPTGAEGAHATAGEYAEEALAGEPAVMQFQRMRRARNRSEYGIAHFTARVIEEDLSHARAIVTAVERDLPRT
jgi:hypothetical protein